jgi:DNA-binding NarL/FixJ family response regulator
MTMPTMEKDCAKTTMSKPSTIRVLIADNSNIVIESLSFRLNREERINVVASTIHATNIIEVAHSAQPDVILANIHLPGMEGGESVSLIRQALPHIPVIVFTIYDLITTRIVFLEAGASAVVQGNQLAERLVREIQRLFPD